MAAHTPDRRDEVVQFGDIRVRPPGVGTVGGTQDGLGRGLGQGARGDRLGKSEGIGGHAAPVAGHRSASASCAATRFSPRWTSVRAVTAGTPMIVAMSPYSRSS